MANYLVTDTELTSIANAIRTKGGTNSNLTFPTGFVNAIGAISTGGGSPEVADTVYQNNNGTYKHYWTYVNSGWTPLEADDTTLYADLDLYKSNLYGMISDSNGYVL